MKHNNKGFIEIILVIAAILAIAGVAALWYVTKNKSGSVNDSLINQNANPSSVTSTPSASDSPTTELDAELDAIVIEDPSLDFKEIDSDLNSL